MSLTKHLADPDSPVRAYLDEVSPRLAATRGHNDGARAVAESLGFFGLTGTRTVVTPFDGVDARLSGTAIDFRARMRLGGFDPQSSVAAQGLHRLPAIVASVENGEHRAQILAEAFNVAERLIRQPKGAEDLDRAAILLAHCEQVYRAGTDVLAGAVGIACDSVSSGEEFASSIDTFQLGDVGAMLDANKSVLTSWDNQITAGTRYDPNPTFTGSPLVGGADGDWIIGDTLIDSKAYEHLSIPKIRGFLRQLLGYVMLDLDDELGIRRVGIWLPRQCAMPMWDLAHLLGGDPDELLPKLRADFIRAASGKQVAVHVPVTDRRKRQVLADNRQTPVDMLTALAFDDDHDLRRRVGRNPATPLPLLGLLANDSKWSVRAAVASNERTPANLLATLATDRSIGVRRAAEANTHSPRLSLKALSSDPDRRVQFAARTNDDAAKRHGEASDLGGDALLPASAPSEVPISRNRDDSVMDSPWFESMVDRLANGDVDSALSTLIPHASDKWARRLNRPIILPNFPEPGIPREVTDYLLQEHRPVGARRAAARSLSLSDPNILDALLTDVDPEIRWEALSRSVETPRTSMSELLADLAASRQARKKFRTSGLPEPSWSRHLTAKQYDQQVIELVARHPSTPLSALDTLAETTSADVLASLLENPSLSAPRFAAIVERMRTHQRVHTRAKLASVSTIPAGVADELATSWNVDVRKALAHNPAASPTSLELLATCSESSLLRAVLENPSTPADARARLAARILEDSDVELQLEVLKTIAERGDISVSTDLIEDVLDQMSWNAATSLTVARDNRTSAPTLARLANSEDDSVRSQVAMNPRTPDDVLRTLATDPEPRVRAAAARNSNLPSSAVREPIRDDSAADSRAAHANPSAHEDDIEQTHEHHSPPSPTREQFYEMAAKARSEVRIQAASHVDTPPDVLQLLSGERRSKRVRRAAAAHPNTPPAALRELSEDADPEVRRAVALNVATPPDALTRLADDRFELALLVAMNPNTAPALNDSLEHDPNPLVAHVSKAIRVARNSIAGGRNGARPQIPTSATPDTSTQAPCAPPTTGTC